MRVFKITLLLSYICIASFSAAIVTPALPALQHFFAISDSSLSWIVSIFLIGYVVGQLIYGPIAKRFGSLTALRAGLVLNVIGIIVCIVGANISSFHLLLFGRLLTALGAASGLACTFMLMHDYLDGKEYKHAMSYAVLSFTLGIGFAVLLGGLITQYFHWQLCFWVLLLHGIIMLCLTWYFHAKYHEPVELHPILIVKHYLHALLNGRLIVFSMVVGFMSAFSYVYSAVAPIYTQQVLHLSSGAYGYWNLINMIGMLAGGILAGKLMKSAGPAKLLKYGLIGLLPCCVSLIAIAFLHMHNILWFFITTMFMYLFGGFLFPSGSYYALHATTDKANGSSMMSFVNMLSAVLCVIIVGYLPMARINSLAVVLTIFFGLIVLLAVMQKLDK